MYFFCAKIIFLREITGSRFYKGEYQLRIRVGTFACFLSIVIAFAGILTIGSSAASSAGINYDLKQINFNASDNVKSTDYSGSHTYHANVSPISAFFDKNGNYNAVYKGTNMVYVAKFNSNMELTGTVSLQIKYPVFGGAVCDNSGNYYVVCGQKDTGGNGQTITLCISKYDSNGNSIGNVLYKGSDTWDSSWGTKEPFNAGNCSLTVKNNLLVCTYARLMYNGYQSNYVVYVNCATMKKVVMAAPYCSHSFDQQVLATGSGAYLFVDHGDEFERGFVISKVSQNSSGKWKIDKFTPFHFREGTNREFGYNETYAQLGGIAEASTGYVLLGSSEKTLSYSIAPNGDDYCGHNEARNLFIQIIKKDFENYSYGSKCVSIGTTRNATGSRPSNVVTTLGLKSGTVDYGVKWLTSYSNDYFAANPQLVITSDNKIAIMWEKMRYGSQSDEYAGTYFMVLSNRGDVLLNPVELSSVRLTSSETPVYKNGSIYWTTSAGAQILTLNKLSISVETQKVTATTAAAAVPSTSSQAAKKKSVAAAVKSTTTAVSAPKVKEKSDSATKPVTASAASSKSKSAVKCAVPSNVKAVKVSANSIKISWNAVKGAAGYQLYRYNPVSKVYEKIKTTSAVSFTDTSLKNGQTYHYKVRAYLKANGANVYSGCSTAAVLKIVAVTQSQARITKIAAESGPNNSGKKFAAVFLALPVGLLLLTKSKVSSI